MEKKDNSTPLFTMKDIEEEISSINELVDKCKKENKTLSEKKIFDAWIHLTWAHKYFQDALK